MAKLKKGNAFIKEKTGSATMLNLDGKSKHDFADDFDDEKPADLRADKKHKATGPAK